MALWQRFPKKINTIRQTSGDFDLGKKFPFRHVTAKEKPDIFPQLGSENLR